MVKMDLLRASIRKAVQKRERARPRYWPRLARAARDRALEISTSPVYGVYISKIKKIAHETESAATNRLHTTVALMLRVKGKIGDINHPGQRSRQGSFGLLSFNFNAAENFLGVRLSNY
jgi:hypothetical protein